MFICVKNESMRHCAKGPCFSYFPCQSLVHHILFHLQILSIICPGASDENEGMGPGYLLRKGGIGEEWGVTLLTGGLKKRSSALRQNIQHKKSKGKKKE